MIEEDTSIMKVKVWDSHEVCYVKWGDDKTWEKALEEMNDGVHYATFTVWSELDHEKDEGTFQAYIYQVSCYKSQKLYYLVSLGEIVNFDDMDNVVCINNNMWIVLRFLKEYLLPFDGGNYHFG